ncbi:MAG: LuxR C-terminal-related transcriptional regulator [Desulfarculales bacterium]|jgi:LuxR family maltose regulon positive regulatory protein|nr:LuxR C-terminal-related transcriptional regulator [Desulfarculales bacterium]
MERQNPLYFSARLRERLREALSARSVLVEAPAGYGKTTAIQDGLRPLLPKGAVFIRHVCAEESPRSAWRRLCRTLQKIDAKAGAALLGLDVPDEDSFGEAAEILREMECPSPVWLALDDFHRIAQLVPVYVWKAFLEHDAPRLHLTLMARPLAESVMLYEKASFLRISLEDLRLTEGESREYLAAAEAMLTERQIQELYRRCEGWILALFLHLRHYRKTGSFAEASTSDMSCFLRESVWDGLEQAGRDFLLRLSPFETWTEEQAACLSQLPELPASAIAFLRHNAFIRFDADSGCYATHSTLLEFVREMRKTLSAEQERAILYAAGDWCALQGEREKAIAFYYRLRDFEKILALNLSGLEDNRLMDLPDLAYGNALRDIAAHCTREMKIRYPMSVIQLAFEFFGQGRYREFSALCAEMSGLIKEIPAPQAERNRLAGELLLLEAFTKYNSITEMGRRMKAAAQLTGGRPSLISQSNSWTFGNASVLLMYHSQAGRLDAELADMETCCPYYVALTEGHGSGGATLMRAEALFCRGKATEAEIFCRQARHEAELNGQNSVLIGADLLLGRLAILRGQGSELAAVQERLARQAQENPQKSDRLEAGLALAFLAGLLPGPGWPGATDWLLQDSPASFARRLFTQAVPYACLCRAGLLLLSGKPETLLGEADAARALAQELRYPLALIYSHIHSAVAWNMLGQRGKARAELNQALALALPDGLYMPLAENYGLIGPILAKALSGKKQTKALSRLEALAKQMGEGRESVLMTVHAQELSPSENSADRQAGDRPAGEIYLQKLHAFASLHDLTDREISVLSCILRKLSVKEMAGSMGISGRGIKFHISNILNKTKVKKRRNLLSLYVAWKM